MPQENTKESKKSSHNLKSNQNPKVFISHNARANLKLREISVSEVERVLRKGTVAHIDKKTGHLVYKIDNKFDSIRVVAKKEGDSIIVITAMRPQELFDHV